jgi:hypothetical protein
MPDLTEAQLLIRIETKLDMALRAQDDHEGRIRALESHGTLTHGDRITALERWRYALPVAALLSLVSIVAAVTTAYLR